MDLLLHICCAPCSIYSWQYFEQQGYNIEGYFFNPNIHPYKEFERRKNALLSLMEEENRKVKLEGDYPLEDFLTQAVKELDDRCRLCYTIRLKQTAVYAREQGIKNFSTTLLLSPYQNHELLKEVGFKIAAEQEINFIYTDLRPGFKESIRRARESNIYVQGYCGCVFSEKERYYSRSKT